MTRARKGQRARFSDVLRETFHRAAATVYGDRVALYVVGLTDAHGFAVAQRVNARVQGPDPAVLRARSLSQGLREPLMVGSAPVETSALDGVAGRSRNQHRRSGRWRGRSITWGSASKRNG